MLDGRTVKEGVSLVSSLSISWKVIQKKEDIYDMQPSQKQELIKHNRFIYRDPDAPVKKETCTEKKLLF